MEFCVPVVSLVKLRENFVARHQESWSAIMLVPLSFRLTKRRHVNTYYICAVSSKVSARHI